MPDRKLFHAEFAWLGSNKIAKHVLIAASNGLIESIDTDTPPPPGCTVLQGLTIPGLANSHSHVFHRALRGHTHGGADDFWSWRKLMYQIAEKLTPEQLYDLAFATYIEMALAGITSVGEFHYLHHGPGGTPYNDANLTGEILIRAANDAGIRITLLDTCYLQADINGSPLSGAQQRFDDRSAEQWIERVSALRDGPMARVGVAIHSVRAVPLEAIGPIRAYAVARGLPLHIHLSEQPAENEACLSRFGCTPTQLLNDQGAWGTATTAVHATHLTDADITILGDAKTHISMCCTTERDLADGVGPAVELERAGSILCLGSDSHAVIDLFEEARAVELDERLISGKRGHFQPHQLLTAATRSGATSLGWPAGRLEVGLLADFVTVDLDTPRTAGSRSGDLLGSTVFAATGADVTDVVVGGEILVTNGAHVTVDTPGLGMAKAIAAILQR